MASHDEEAEINPYELLGLTSDATDKDIKTAYRQRSLKVHPDRNPNNPDAGAHESPFCTSILANNCLPQPESSTS